MRFESSKLFKMHSTTIIITSEIWLKALYQHKIFATGGYIWQSLNVLSEIIFRFIMNIIIHNSFN